MICGVNSFAQKGYFLAHMILNGKLPVFGDSEKGCYINWLSCFPRDEKERQNDNIGTLLVSKKRCYRRSPHLMDVEMGWNHAYEHMKQTPGR
jgi:hypothetical protein